jgi:hypothetical protein
MTAYPGYEMFEVAGGAVKPPDSVFTPPPVTIP